MSIDTLTNNALAAFKAGDFQKAVNLYEEAYQLNQTVALNMALVSSLYAAEQFVQAYRIATELSWDTYATNEEQEQFIRVALRAEQPIAARKMLAKYDEDTRELHREIEQVETRLRSEQAVKIKTMTREFYHLGEALLTEQQQVLQEYEQLPLDEYIFGAKGVLMDPFAHPLTRATVFASLQQLAVNDELSVVTVLGETEIIVPKQLTSLQETTTYQVIRKLLIEQETQMDPVIWQGLSQQSQLMLQIMYPFIDEAIEDPVQWLADLQAILIGEFGTNSETKQGRWQQATIQAMTEIFGF